jgi:hypothetical protein
VEVREAIGAAGLPCHVTDRVTEAVTAAGAARLSAEVGRCRLTVSKPVLKAPRVSALEAIL